MVKDLFIYLLLFLAGLVFVAESGLSLVMVSEGGDSSLQ